MSTASAGMTGVILAGGAGRRMGGADKGLLSLHGRPLAEHVIDRLQPQVDRLCIVANRNLDTYREFGHPVLADQLPDFSGPLVGMLSGLAQSTAAQTLFVPADAPCLPDRLARRLAEADAPAAFACDAHGPQPLCCLLSDQLLPDLQNAVEAGERSPQRWLQSVGAREVLFDEPEWIWSVNTPQELAALQEQAELVA